MALLEHLLDQVLSSPEQLAVTTSAPQLYIVVVGDEMLLKTSRYGVQDPL